MRSNLENDSQPKNGPSDSQQLAARATERPFCFFAFKVFAGLSAEQGPRMVIFGLLEDSGGKTKVVLRMDRLH